MHDAFFMHTDTNTDACTCIYFGELSKQECVLCAVFFIKEIVQPKNVI